MWLLAGAQRAARRTEKTIFFFNSKLCRMKGILPITNSQSFSVLSSHFIFSFYLLVLSSRSVFSVLSNIRNRSIFSVRKACQSSLFFLVHSISSILSSPFYLLVLSSPFNLLVLPSPFYHLRSIEFTKFLRSSFASPPSVSQSLSQ